MSRRIFWGSYFAALLLFIVWLCVPASAERFIFQGDELFKACVTGVEARHDPRYAVCIGFVWGVADTDQEFKACTADREIHGMDMSEVVTNYAKAHPEHRDFPGAVQVRLALFSAFCPDAKPTWTEFE